MISVFGSTGFIGGRFCELYPEQSIKISRNDYSSKSSEILYFISTIDNYNIHQDLHVDVDTNLSILMSMLENIDREDPNLVINFVSSWFVYGKNSEMPFKEDTSYCNPTGFYSITKRCAEQMLISFCETFNIKYRIFRLANVLGEQDQKISRKKNAVQFLIKQAVHGEELLLYNGGNAIRDYIYVDDVCDAIKHCIDNAPVDEIINIGMGEPSKLVDVINKAMEEADSKSKVTVIKPPHFHDVVQVEHSYLDVSKLKSYGYSCKYTIDEIVTKLINYYKQQNNE
jgi:nucleoside-diphosphate-sugar epimerase